MLMQVCLLSLFYPSPSLFLLFFYVEGVEEEGKREGRGVGVGVGVGVGINLFTDRLGAKKVVLIAPSEWENQVC